MCRMYCTPLLRIGRKSNLYDYHIYLLSYIFVKELEEFSELLYYKSTNKWTRSVCFVLKKVSSLVWLNVTMVPSAIAVFTRWELLVKTTPAPSAK